MVKSYLFCGWQSSSCPWTSKGLISGRNFRLTRPVTGGKIVLNQTNASLQTWQILSLSSILRCLGKGSYSSMRHCHTCQDSILLLSTCCLLSFHLWIPALSVVGQELGCLLELPSGTCLPVLRNVHTVRGIILVLSVERVGECCLASQLEHSALKWIEPWLRS